MKLGFIGIGNMASAIIKGISDKTDIVISTRSKGQEKAEQLKVQYAASNKACAKVADILFLCVKPQQFAEVLSEIKDELKGTTLVSIAAKLTIKDIQDMSGINEVIRVMPNLNVAIKQGTSAICHDSSVDTKALNEVKQIFENLGDVEAIDESLFAAFIGIAGSAPAFIFEFMEALMQEALVEGMDQEQALRITTSSMRGSAAYLNESGIDAKTLVDRVCSPGGTTIEGINSLREDNFQSVVSKAVRKTIDKDKN